MKPNFFVFCEGKTEVTYVKFLSSVYRVPIQIIPRKSESNISKRYIDNCKRDYVTTDKDKTFLMFDLDVANVLGHLQEIKDTILLVSNPCIELWFLLHFEECKSEIPTNDCVERLKSHSGRYTKGKLTEHERQVLASSIGEATTRAKKLHEYHNPSTTVYRLIECINQFV